MTTKRRLVFRIMFAVSVLGGIAVAVILGLALAALSTGPTIGGYDLLAVAIEALPYLAAVVVLTVILGSIGTRVRFAIGGLALASVIVGGVALGLVGIGSTMKGIDPLHQPPALNSMVLAVYGVGTQIAPVALVLAAGALVLAAGTVVARRLVSRTPEIPAVAV